MTDYKELIEALREEAEAVQAFEWDIPICTSNHILDAADAIEQLIKERDTAVADLTNIVHDMGNTCICDYCIGCVSNGFREGCKTDDGDRWEWRGVQEESDEKERNL